MSNLEWEGTEKIHVNPCIQWLKVNLLCNHQDEYSITEKRLTIVSKDGLCCFKNEETDNTLRDNIVDVDIKSVAPGCHVLWGGTTMETVIVRTSKGSGEEVKPLRVEYGQGKIVKQILIRE